MRRTTGLHSPGLLLSAGRRKTVNGAVVPGGGAAGSLVLHCCCCGAGQDDGYAGWRWVHVWGQGYFVSRQTPPAAAGET